MRVHVGPANDHGSCAPELTEYWYGIHRNSVIIWVRFRGLFVLHSLNHNRFHFFSLILFKHDYYYNYNYNLLL